MRSHSTIPRAGTGYGGQIECDIGLICQPPAGHSIGGGATAGSPSGAPRSTHAAIVAISDSLSDRSLLKWPYCGSANHGGIALVTTACLIAFAHGRVSFT